MFNAFDFEAQVGAAAGSFGNGYFYRAVNGRRFDFASQDALIKPDGNFDMDILALARELGMRADMDFNIGITAFFSLALKAQLLAVLDTFRNGDIQRTSIRHGNALAAAQRRFRKIDVDAVAVMLRLGKTGAVLFAIAEK